MSKGINSARVTETISWKWNRLIKDGIFISKTSEIIITHKSLSA